jgi:hypothetical protein
VTRPIPERPFDLRAVDVFLGQPSAGGPGLPSVLEHRLGIDRRWTYRRYYLGVDDQEADRIACGLGVHPSVIWPDWFEEIINDHGLRDSAEQYRQRSTEAQRRWRDHIAAETRRLSGAL